MLFTSDFFLGKVLCEEVVIFWVFNCKTKCWIFDGGVCNVLDRVIRKGKTYLMPLNLVEVSPL